MEVVARLCRWSLLSSRYTIRLCHPSTFVDASYQDSYIQSRSTAIESIESTIAELGQIFNQLANMVAEQRETVQRIDADTIDIASNVGGAQRELLKYYASISNNRWLMLKVFGVMIVFVRILSYLLTQCADWPTVPYFYPRFVSGLPSGCAACLVCSYFRGFLTRIDIISCICTCFALIPIVKDAITVTKIDRHAPPAH